MKILCVTNLFPNSEEPERGIFNAQQFVHLARIAELRVVAPLPWTPPAIRFLSPEWSRMARVPVRERVQGIDVEHPRYLVTPKTGRSLYARWMAASLEPVIRRTRQDFPFDVILATWAYPDVVAAHRVAERIGVPLVAKVHGSDINQFTRSTPRRRMIVEALKGAAGVVAVSGALRERLAAFGVPKERVSVIRNAVDLEHFMPVERSVARQRLGLSQQGKHIVFVGHLLPVKGLDVLLEAMTHLESSVRLDLVGEGSWRKHLERRSRQYGLEGRVSFVGTRPHEEISDWMNAADLFCLPSRSEGCPNVVVEALACGTPVIASHVGGIPELLSNETFGQTVPPGDAKALAKALQRRLVEPGKRERISNAPSVRGWEDNARELFGQIQSSLNGAHR